MEKTHRQPRWLSLRQAAFHCGLSEKTLRTYAEAGMLKLHRIIQPGCSRGAVRIDRLKLDALIEKAMAEPSQLGINRGKGGAE